MDFFFCNKRTIHINTPQFGCLKGIIGKILKSLIINMKKPQKTLKIQAILRAEA